MVGSDFGTVGPEVLFLGVDCSVTGKRWVERSGDERIGLALSQRLGLPEIVGRILSSRGIGLDDAASFLEPTLKELLPDPYHLIDMEVAAERLASAVMQGEKIGIFGDYDVDGATSSALLRRFIEAVGGKCRVYIPDRIREGYGPNAPALQELRGEGVTVVVTVDCGTSAHLPLQIATDAGMDIIVADHHTAEASLPRITALVNPNRLDETSPHGHLAAVGVTFLLVVAVNRVLRDAGWYKERPEPVLTRWLDLVALGTVCDVVPLRGVNRALVVQGLKVMAKRLNPGLRALSDVAGIDDEPGAYHAGFVLGPRVNAGGRVGAAGLGAQLLATEDKNEATEIAHRLNKFNQERQQIEAVVLQAAVDQVESGDAPWASESLTIAAGEGWHPGVIGIVASRLKERYNRPACVIAISDGTGSGSGRSVTGVDLGSAVIASVQSGILIKGGGHSMAAGFSIDAKRIKELGAFLDERIGARISEAGIVPTLRIDGALTTGGATLALLKNLEQLAPFGAGNAEPRFVLPSVRISYASVVGSDHVRITIDGEGGKKLNGIAFRCLESPLGQLLLESGGLPLHLVGRLRVNTWQGRSSPQLLIDDAARG